MITKPKDSPVQTIDTYPTYNVIVEENTACVTKNVEICQSTVNSEVKICPSTAGNEVEICPSTADSKVEISVTPRKLEEFFTPTTLLREQLRIDDLKEVKFNSSIFKQLPRNSEMLPHMPSLTSTPMKRETKEQAPHYPDFDEVITEIEVIKSLNTSSDEARKVCLNSVLYLFKNHLWYSSHLWFFKVKF